MRVYRISQCNYIYDLSGTGAAMYGGRWNSKGTYILYTAGTSSLALLETVVHLSRIITSDFCMICITVPEESIAEIKQQSLPSDWFVNPPRDSLKVYGDIFIQENKYLALKIPSAIMPEENNFLLNPNHPNFKKMKVEYIRKVSVDNRLIKK